MRIAFPSVIAAAAVLAAAPVAAAGQAPASPGAPDTTAPVLSAVSIDAAAVRAADGIRVSFTLDEVANVAGVVAQHRSGYLVDGRCRPGAARRGPGKNRRARKACTKLVRVGSFYVASAPAGANVVKLGLKALKPGRYRATLTPRDRTGNLGAAAIVAFRIVA